MVLQELGSENVEVSQIEHYSMQVNLCMLYNVPFGIKCISAQVNEDWYEKANETVPTYYCEGVDRVNTDGE